LLHVLHAGGFEVTHEAAATQAAMRAALRHHQWDVIISDYALPQFSGSAALASLEKGGNHRELNPEAASCGTFSARKFHHSPRLFSLIGASQ
jgi:CheY-like chemotaxis protein